jgi:hypothetical protein
MSGASPRAGLLVWLAVAWYATAQPIGKSFETLRALAADAALETTKDSAFHIVATNEKWGQPRLVASLDSKLRQRIDDAGAWH